MPHLPLHVSDTPMFYMELQHYFLLPLLQILMITMDLQDDNFNSLGAKFVAQLFRALLATLAYQGAS